MKTPDGVNAISLACVASFVLLLAQPVPAHAGLRITQGEGTGAVRVTATNTSDSACGAELNISDGKTERKRLEPREQWEIQHAFRADGTFTVALSGAAIFRGMRTVGPCDLRQQVTVTVAGGQTTAAAPPPVAAAAAAPSPEPVAKAPSPGESADFVLFSKKDSNTFRFVTAIDGTKKLDSGERLVNSGYQLCYVFFPDVYKELAGADAQSLIEAEVGRAVNALAGNRQIRSRRMECVQSGRFVGAAFTDVVAVQRRVVADLRRIREFSDNFEPFAEVKYERLAQVVAAGQQVAQQRQQAVATWTAEIAALSSAGSEDKLGSLTLSMPKDPREKIKACTLEYSGPQGQAVIAYRNSLLRYTSPAFRSKASEVSATFDAKDSYAEVYRTLNDFYVDYQKDPRKCHVYVDFPKNLSTLMTALERDRKGVAVEVNELVAAAELREAWAKAQGYDSLADSEFAAQIRGNAASLKSLADKGIRDKAAYDQVAGEMRAARYADGGSVREVLAYLDDKAAAARKPGATPVSIRDERTTAQREESQRREQEAQKQRAEYAKEFPFTATLICGMNDRHLNIMACTSGRGSLKSELELTNGTQYKMYQPWEIRQVGRETSEGVVIALRSNYKIQLQNVHDTLILTLKVVSNATGNVIYTKSASRFGLVYHKN